MKRYIRSSSNPAWTAKYLDIYGEGHKVVAELPTNDYAEAEAMFDEIVPPYRKLQVLGRVLSVETAEKDGFEVLQY